MNSDRTQKIVCTLRETRKYKYLCEEILIRIANWAFERHPDFKNAVKAAKRKLHQVYGAYFDSVRFDEIETTVKELSKQEKDTKIFCKEILETHASTAERLPILADFYRDLFREIGKPNRILDLGCGMNPFSLPWMGLDSSVQYCAWDIDLRLMALLSQFFDIIGQESETKCIDLLGELPTLEADVAFLFKFIPCLEQQKRGAGKLILEKIQARNFVLSFPSLSLGGRDRGMQVHYAENVNRLASELMLKVRAMKYPGETFYLLAE